VRRWRSRWRGAPAVGLLLASWLVAVPFVLARTDGSRSDPAPAHRLAHAAALPRCTLIGTRGDDVLTGTSGHDVICARGGNDVVHGGGGDDVIFGGKGADRLDGGAGNDHLYGYGGKDRFNGGPGNDFLQGSAGADLFSGGAGSDIVDYGARTLPIRVTIGRGANDGRNGEHDNVRGDVENVRAGSGNDTLTGNARANRLLGGGGRDNVVGGRGNDRLFGGAGRDRLDGRDAARFADSLDCGPGRPDAALANARDTVAANCERVEQPKQPAGGKHAPTDVGLSKSSVAENQPSGTEVGTLSAVDRDRNDRHTFALVTGSGSADNGSFAIAGSTLKTNAVFDYETKHSYSVRVRTTDRRGASFEKAFTVAVTDVSEHVNRAPSDIALSKSSVGENQPAGATVGALSASDPDAGDSHTYSLVPGDGSANNNSFAVDGSTLKTADVFDYEAKHSYSIRLRTQDGAGSAFEKAFTIAVDNRNDGPTAQPRLVSGVTEDGSKTIQLQGVDPEGDALTFHVAAPGHGHVDTAGPAATCDGATPGTCTASVVYTPDANYHGPDTFTYTVDDGTTISPAAAVSTTVDAVNDAPQATDGDTTVAEDATAAPVDLGALASDVETGDADLTYDIVSPASHGVVTGSGATPTYTPNPDYNGSDAFTYQVSDRGDPDGCSGAPCDGPESSATKTVSITVTPVNDEPVAATKSVNLDEDTPAAVDLGALTSDLETSAGDLSYAIVGQPTHGTLSGSGANRTYTPAADYHGPDSFTYEVTDRGDPENCGAPAAGCAAPKSSVGTVSLTVAPVNDAPRASSAAKNVGEDHALPVDLGALVSDVETANADLTYEIDVGPAHGTISGTGASLTYTPEANYNGPDGFTYKVTDRGDPDNCSSAPCDAAESSSTEAVAITVAAVNDVPTARDASRSLSEDGSLPVDLTALADDVETPDANLTYTIVSDPKHGALTGPADSPTYTPNLDFNGADSFSYTVSDGTDQSAPATVSITVDPVNDAPQAASAVESVDEDHALPVDLAALAFDKETSDADLSYTIVSAPTHGGLSGDGGSPIYTPDLNYNGPDEFTYKVTDRGAELEHGDRLDHRQSGQRHATGRAREPRYRRGHAAARRSGRAGLRCGDERRAFGVWHRH
jgi:Ca2+-binding RTX toxin-like protein